MLGRLVGQCWFIWDDLGAFPPSVVVIERDSKKSADLSGVREISFTNPALGCGGGYPLQFGNLRSREKLFHRWLRRIKLKFVSEANEAITSMMACPADCARALPVDNFLGRESGNRESLVPVRTYGRTLARTMGKNLAPKVTTIAESVHAG